MLQSERSLVGVWETVTIRRSYLDKGMNFEQEKEKCFKQLKFFNIYWDYFQFLYLSPSTSTSEIGMKLLRAKVACGKNGQNGMLAGPKSKKTVP
jgi:hypothetical protein